MSEKIKILCLSDSPTLPTGFARVSRELMERLAKLPEFEIYFCGYNWFGGELENYYLDDPNMQQIHINYRLLPGTQDAPYAQRVLQHYINRFRPDILFVLLDTFMLYGQPNFEKPWFSQIDLTGVKFVMYYPSDGGRFPYKCESILKMSQYPIAMAKFGQRQVADSFGIWSDYIPHHVQTKLFHPLTKEERRDFRARYAIPEDAFVFGTVARNQGRKNLQQTVEAFAKFMKRNPNANAYLFMHSVSDDSPIIIRRDGKIEVIPIRELREWTGKEYEALDIPDTEVWSDGAFHKIKYASRHIYDGKLLRVNCGNGLVDVTDNHSMLNSKREVIKASELKVNDDVAVSVLPKLQEDLILDDDLAWLLGFFVAEGTCGRYLDKSKNIYGSTWNITNKDKELLYKAKRIIKKVFDLEGSELFDSGNGVYRLDCKSLSNLFREWCYTRSNRKALMKCEKKVPNIILRANKSAKAAFLTGYNDGDGNHTERLKDELTMFTTNSKTLAMGLCILLENSERTYRIYSEERNGKNQMVRSYYKIAIHSSSPNRKLQKKIGYVSKIIPLPKNRQWVYDICVENSFFNTGIGNIVVHNTDPNDQAAWMSLPAQIEMFKIQDRVRFSGMRAFQGFKAEEMRFVYGIMDVHALTTSGEGFGIPTIEAMCCGVPVVATDYTTTDELTDGGKCGWKVPLALEFDGTWNVPRGFVQLDDIVHKGEVVRAGFVSAMEDAYKNPEKLKEFSRLAREKVLKEYSFDDVVFPRWVETLKKIALM